jgi:hypothetical protein
MFYNVSLESKGIESKIRLDGANDTLLLSSCHFGLALWAPQLQFVETIAISYRSFMCLDTSEWGLLLHDLKALQVIEVLLDVQSILGLEGLLMIPITGSPLLFQTFSILLATSPTRPYNLAAIGTGGTLQ